MSRLVFPVFEWQELSANVVGAFMGVYSSAELAYAAACKAANSVTLFYGNEIFTSDMMLEYFERTKSNLVLTGENDLQVIIFYAPLDMDFITND